MGNVLSISDNPLYIEPEENPYAPSCCKLDWLHDATPEWVKSDDGTRLGRNEAGGILVVAALAASVGSPVYDEVNPELIGRALNRAGYSIEDLSKIIDGYQNEENRPRK